MSSTLLLSYMCLGFLGAISLSFPLAFAHLWVSAVFASQSDSCKLGEPVDGVCVCRCWALCLHMLDNTYAAAKENHTQLWPLSMCPPSLPPSSPSSVPSLLLSTSLRLRDRTHRGAGAHAYAPRSLSSAYSSCPTPWTHTYAIRSVLSPILYFCSSVH